MSKRWQISRRAVLRGAGAMIALPYLDAMAAPARAAAAAASATGTAKAAPTRMVTVFVPNGFYMDGWKVPQSPTFQLPSTLKGLEALKYDLTVISGLAHNNARALGDGAGDHARSAAVFLTGLHPLKTIGKDIRAGISADQLAAKAIGEQTLLPSLELGCDGGAQSGNCDSGYSCAYSSNISWRSPNQPMPKETSPRAVFDRLFGAESLRDRARQNALQRSILDLALEDAHRLQSTLGTADQRKLEEYLDSVRQVERQIQAAERSDKSRAVPDLHIPDGKPPTYAEHARLMMDLIVLAFQTDTTRVATFMLANEGSNRTYGAIGIREAHHELSHHEGKAEKLDKIRRIDEYNVEQLNYLLTKLKASREDGGNLLDRSMVLYGCSIADGNRHDHGNLSMLLAGRGGGTINPGRHIACPTDTPVCNLLLSMLDRMGVKSDRFGDSTARLSQLTT